MINTLTKAIAILLLIVFKTGSTLAIESEEMGRLHLHPVDIKVPNGMTPPEDFPLGPGRTLICETCHAIKGLKETPYKEIDRDAPGFLRGGSYTDLADFCFRCHEKTDYKRQSIHRMLDEKGRLIKEGCLYCHMEVPDPEVVRDTGDVKFRLPPEELCIGCHLKTPHLNALNHLKEPEKEMKMVIKRSEQKFGIILPLDSKGRIMCATCHSPHERGVIRTDIPAGRQVADTDLEEGISYVESRWNEVFTADKQKRLRELSKITGRDLDLKYMKIKKEVLLRLPAKDGTLCRACHRFRR